MHIIVPVTNPEGGGWKTRKVHREKVTSNQFLSMVRSVNLHKVLPFGRSNGRRPFILRDHRRLSDVSAFIEFCGHAQ